MRTGRRHEYAAGTRHQPDFQFSYVMTFIAPLTLGQWTIIINVLMVLAQIAILRKEFQWFQMPG